MCNNIELWDMIDDHDAERACSLLKQPNDRKLTQALNGYDRATGAKQRRRRTALLCALCLIDGEIGIQSIIRAVNRLCDTRGIDTVDEKSIADFVSYMKMDSKAKEIMREIVDKLDSMSSDMESQKLARKFEVRMNFIEHKPKSYVPFKVHWY